MPAKPRKVPENKKKPIKTESKEMTLQEKIMEQKSRLRHERRGKADEKKPSPVKRKPVHSPPTRSNYHKRVEQTNYVQARAKPEAISNRVSDLISGNEPERGDRRYSRNPSSKIRSPAPIHSPNPEKEEEPRFDSENFLKSATAFNIGTNLSQSQLRIVTGDLEEPSFTERILQRNNIQNFSGKIPPRALSTEERLFSQCTFRPKFEKCPREYSNVQPRVLKHFDASVTERPPSAANASFVHQSFSRISGEGQSLFDRRGQKPKPMMGHSASTDRLGVSISADFANVSSINSLQSCFNSLKVSVFEKPNANFFDIKSNKKLGYVLQHGYSFKHHEKKHYNAKKSVDAYRRAGQEFLNVTMQNRSVMESLCQPKPEAKPGLNMSASSQSLYADLFTERYRRLTKNIIEDLKEGEKKPAERVELDPDTVTEQRVSQEFNNAKMNRTYKELGINLNLKEIFNGLGYNDLMKLRKLHVLYATQGGKAKLSKEEGKAKTEA